MSNPKFQYSKQELELAIKTIEQKAKIHRELALEELEETLRASHARRHELCLKRIAELRAMLNELEGK